jgi:hypothetical protein
LTSKTAQSQRFFQYAFFFHRFTVDLKKEFFSLHPPKNDWKVNMSGRGPKSTFFGMF